MPTCGHPKVDANRDYTSCIVAGKLTVLRYCPETHRLTENLPDTAERTEQPLTVRPALSRAAARFVARHPDEVQRLVAAALEQAAALEAAGIPAPARSRPAALQRLVTSARAAGDEGRVLSISETAERLRVTRVTVYAWIEAKRLVAWRVTRRGVLVPAEQIVRPGAVVPGIARVLAVISDPAAAWDFLTQQSPCITPEGLRRPIDALKVGEIDPVIAAAHSFLDAFTQGHPR
jgi:excisionase family DNA binding protein